MIILLIGIAVLVGLANIAYYEYRAIKNTDHNDIVNEWVNMKLKRRYK